MKYISASNRALKKRVERIYMGGVRRTYRNQLRKAQNNTNPEDLVLRLKTKQLSILSKITGLSRETHGYHVRWNFVQMKRHESWRLEYRANRYMRDLTLEELLARAGHFLNESRCTRAGWKAFL